MIETTSIDNKERRVTKKEEEFLDKHMTNVRALNLTRSRVLTRDEDGDISANGTLLEELDRRINDVCDSAQVLLLEVRLG